MAQVIQPASASQHLGLSASGGPKDTVERVRVGQFDLLHRVGWKIGTIAAELGIHHDTVRRAIGTESFAAATKQQARARLTEPYEEFVRQILKQYPKLRATRIFEMVRQRGYTGSVITLNPRLCGGYFPGIFVLVDLFTVVVAPTTCSLTTCLTTCMCYP